MILPKSIILELSRDKFFFRIFYNLKLKIYMIGKKLKVFDSNPRIYSQITPDFNKMIKVIFFNSLGFFYYLFLLSNIPTQYFNATGPQIGMVFSCNTIGILISSIIIGPLSDKYGKMKKKLVSFGSFGRSIALILMYFAINFKSLKLFNIAIFFQGFIVMFFWTPLDTLISEKSSKKYRSKAFAKRTSLIGIGSLVGTLIAFCILGFSSYFFPHNLWLFYSPLVIFAFCNIYAGIKFHNDVNENLIIINHNRNETNIEQIEQNSNRRVVIGFVLLLIVTFLISINNSFANPFLQAYLIDNIVQDPMIIMLIYFPAHIFGYILAPKLSALSLRVNIYVSITSICIFGAISTWIVISTTSGLIFSMVLLFDSLFVIVEELIIKTYSSEISPDHRGKIFSSMSFVKYGGAIVAPIIGGFVWENVGHKVPFQITIIAEVLLAIPYVLSIYFLIPRRNGLIRQKSKN